MVVSRQTYFVRRIIWFIYQKQPPSYTLLKLIYKNYWFGGKSHVWFKKKKSFKVV